ncbi:site-specific DNA-methyltransferase [Xanthomonas campestris pv. campestris]|uniref:DNA-methyltransferase n=2 Tax=Xanthomonas campestris TaxID=339 RepID=UPI001A179C38|nr:site-specific DNA-methyltransferase [Xanthomonas campestris]MBF9172115.1 site-specific DNA-methyltransferase [Xanthomonas campestris pv. campestris]MDO0847065.1 site-specific DNA-methyltransferase [Xanthomonas campestris pv. campestris]MEB1415127.1 site-specific DNA-methyltransferase [Xanthomonas campestris pv. campestris]MEB1460724.1 site-specific DNA-methyltransferase [Xanthomonas campestris pv. campestris]MEB1501852.1 site-specific DNA-methyltransferase [Xanthomonas campestris pv. campes
MKNQLLQGDALTILPTLEANSFDALITDPPYASGGLTAAARAKPPSQKYVQGGGAQLHADFVGDERDQRSHLKWMHLWLSECARVLKDGAPVLLFTDWRQLPLTTDALQIAGFTWRGITVWDKTEGVRPQLGRFRNQAEYIVWGSKGNMPLDRRAPVLPGVIRESVRKADKHHLTGKPTELMRQLVRICEAGGRVLDPFAGSGTTLVAAQLEGFEAVGIEMTDQYTAVTRDRLTVL